jgi:hypothetical protein
VSKEDADFEAFNARWRPAGLLLPNWQRTYTSGAFLEHVAGDPSNPFWVVEASPEVVDGHNGIFRPVFLDFLRQLCEDRLRRGVSPTTEGSVPTGSQENPAI